MTLSQRLFLRIVPMLIATVLLVGGLTWHSATREITHIYDAELINYADMQRMRLERRLDRSTAADETVTVPDIDFSVGDQLELNEDADDYADAHAFRFWKDGRLAFVSKNAFPASVPPFRSGFADFVHDGSAWRVYTLRIPNTGIVVEAAEMTVLRYGLVRNILWEIALPLLVLIPLLAAIVWLAIHSGLSTIGDLVKQIRSRTPENLDRLSVEGMPADLVPVVRSVNQLMQKLDVSLAMERSFADLAAHQLRTPQAGTRLLLQMLRDETDPAERRVLETRLLESNARSMHLINQLLHFARVGHQVMTPGTLDLHDVLATSVSDLATMIEARRITCVLEGPDHAPVTLDRLLLRLLIDNLLDNAVKYSPEGGQLAITLAPAPEGWTVTIDDEGPGIPAAAREAAFRPFYQLPGISRAGSGLGLAIVASAAARLGVQIDLDTPPGGRGLRVVLRIPAETPDH